MCWKYEHACVFVWVFMKGKSSLSLNSLSVSVSLNLDKGDVYPKIVRVCRYIEVWKVQVSISVQKRVLSKRLRGFKHLAKQSLG